MNERPALKVCLVAGEESGDRLGAALMRALRPMAETVHFCGIGRTEMIEQGLQSLVPAREISFIGLGMIRHLPAIYAYIRDAAAAIVAAEPDVLVIIDSPELTHRIARRVRQLRPSIPIINYVSPTVWVWRSHRARAMRSYVDHVLGLFPFEPKVHSELGGPPCSYVGHPLMERLSELRPDATETARRWSDPPVLLVMLGSRSAEIMRLSDVFGEAVAQLQARCGAMEVVIPTIPHLLDAVTAATAKWTVRCRIVVEPAARWAAVRTARAALAKSGTVTLELALAGVPMVVAYKVPLVEELVARATIKVTSVVLANLVIGENLIPEFLQRDVTAKNLADALVPLLADTSERRRQIDAFARLDAIMQIQETPPSERAARIVMDYAKRTAPAPASAASGAERQSA
jgi:lipid-A-disaccharide synthase